MSDPNAQPNPPANNPPPGNPPPAAPPAGAGDPWFSKADLGLSQEHRDYIAQKNPTTLDEFVKSARTFEQLARDRNAMTGPQEGKLGEWDGWEKLGWNPDATKYQAPVFEKFKEDEAYGNLHAAVVKAAHGAKVPPALLQPITDAIGAHINALNEADDRAAEQQKQQMLTGLKQKWGNSYDANVEMAKRAMAFTGIPTDAADILEAITGYGPLIEHFHKIGTMLGEDRLVSTSNGGQGGFGAPSPIAARAERQRLEADKEFMASLNDPRHPMHQANTEKRRRLFEQEAAGQK